LGQALGALLTGELYSHYGEKATLSLKYLMQHTQFGAGKIWDGNVDKLEAVAGISRSDAFAKLQAVLGLPGPQVTKILLDPYHPPSHIWLPLAGIGIVAAIALAIFGQRAKRWHDMNA